MGKFASVWRPFVPLCYAILSWALVGYGVSLITSCRKFRSKENLSSEWGSDWSWWPNESEKTKQWDEASKRQHQDRTSSSCCLQYWIRPRWYPESAVVTLICSPTAIPRTQCQNPINDTPASIRERLISSRDEIQILLAKMPRQAKRHHRSQARKYPFVALWYFLFYPPMNTSKPAVSFDVISQMQYE